jgi:hypothetical protein
VPPYARIVLSACHLNCWLDFVAAPHVHRRTGVPLAVPLPYTSRQSVLPARKYWPEAPAFGLSARLAAPGCSARDPADGAVVSEQAMTNPVRPNARRDLVMRMRGLRLSFGSPTGMTRREDGAR